MTDFINAALCERALIEFDIDALVDGLLDPRMPADIRAGTEIRIHLAKKSLLHLDKMIMDALARLELDKEVIHILKI